MTLKTRFKNLGNILAEDETQTDIYARQPGADHRHVRAMLAYIGDKRCAVDCTIAAGRGRGGAARARLDRIRARPRRPCAAAAPRSC